MAADLVGNEPAVRTGRVAAHSSRAPAISGKSGAVAASLESRRTPLTLSALLGPVRAPKSVSGC